MVTSYSRYYIVTKIAIVNILNEIQQVILTRQGSELQRYEFPTYNLLSYYPLGYSALPLEKNISRRDRYILFTFIYLSKRSCP